MKNFYFIINDARSIYRMIIETKTWDIQRLKQIKHFMRIL